MLRHEDSDNIDNFPTGLNMKLYNQGFPFLYNTFYQGEGQNFARGGPALATPLVYTLPDEFGTGLKVVLFRLFTCEFGLLRGSLFHWFSCVYTAENRWISVLCKHGLKVILQFCIAHFYCAHLITYNFIHYTYHLKQNIILWQLYVTSKHLWLHSCKELR
jgi:hypothetical protein